VEDELIDQNFGVARDRQGRLIGEEQLRLADARRLDALVADDVMADHELAKRLVRDLAGCVGVHGSGDADLLRSTECRSVEGRALYRRVLGTVGLTPGALRPRTLNRTAARPILPAYCGCAYSAGWRRCPRERHAGWRRCCR